jgi:putative aldouronate transport system substrate-binding protein
MKRTITLLLSLVMVVALFAGCGGTTTTTASKAPSATTAASAAVSAAPTAAAQLVENGKKPIYNVKYNKNGVAAEMFDYKNSLPLTKDTSNKFTWWMSFTESEMAFYNISDVADLPAHKKLRELTGVNMEYKIVDSTAMATAFATMLAADAFTDLISSAKTYYPQSMLTGVSDGYFANIYNYLEYMPCYQYTINNLTDEVWNNAYMYDKVMPFMISTTISLYNTQGIIIRDDYLKKIGMTGENVRTVDEMHDTLVKLKAAGIQWPLMISSNGDLFYGGISAAYGTIGNISIMNSGGTLDVYVVDGKVKFPYCEDALKQYITTVSKWFKEGLVDPDWTSYIYGKDPTMNAISTGRVGVTNLSISFIARAQAAAADKNASFVGIPNLTLKRGDTQHLKWSTASYLASGVTFSVSSDCKNIPLLLSWCDYWFSEDGFMLTQYGIKGQSYTVDSSGQIWWTEEVYKNKYGLSIASCWNIYATNSMGRRDVAKGNYYPGGIANLTFTKAWDSVDCDYAWKWPTAVELTEDQQNQFATIFSDLSTLIVENYSLFITGQKPISDWDSYVTNCKAHGLDKAIAIYQAAYDKWVSSKPKRPTV